jgi:Arc/MetJ-type ribon-helix-helix transcriptional regulator
MKIRISATIEKETDTVLDELMKEGNYRNKSHLIEFAIKFLKDKTLGKDK